MKLADYLLYRDIQDLSQMATYYQCDCNRNSKLELVQSIYHHMLDKKLFTELLEEVELPLIHFYNYILFQQTSTFSVDELVAKGKYICELFSYDESPRKWIAECLKRGWLFPASSKYQVQLEIPVDFQPFLKKQWIQYWSNKYQIEPNKVRGKQVREEGYSLLYDLYTFLSFVKEHPLPLTLDGVIHKRYQQIVINKFNISEQLINEKMWRFGYGRRFPNYPNRFALLYDYCFFKSWIKEDHEILFITNKGEEVLHSEDQVNEALHFDVVKYWIKAYKNAIPSLSFLIQFLPELLAKQWVESNQLYSIVRLWIQPYYYDDEETIFRERITQMLVHLGLMQVAVSEVNGLTYLRVHPLINRDLKKNNHAYQN
jgi:hypothetical protein